MDSKERRETIRALLHAADVLEAGADVRAARVHDIKPRAAMHKAFGEVLKTAHEATTSAKGGAYPDLDVNLQEVSGEASKARSILRALESIADKTMDPYDKRFDKLLTDLAGAMITITYNLGAARSLADLGHTALPASAENE
jgi:flagellar hook-basal body complex protein FliE